MLETVGVGWVANRATAEQSPGTTTRAMSRATRSWCLARIFLASLDVGVATAEGTGRHAVEHHTQEHGEGHGREGRHHRRRLAELLDRQQREHDRS